VSLQPPESRQGSLDVPSASSNPAPRTSWRLLWLVPLVPLAVAVGLAGAFVQSAHARVAGVALPWGVALAVAGTAGLVLLARSLLRSRWALGLVVLMWFVGVIPFTIERPEGDLVITSGGYGLAFLFGGVLVVGLGLGFSTPSVATEGGPGASDIMNAPPRSLAGPPTNTP